MYYAIITRNTSKIFVGYKLYESHNELTRLLCVIIIVFEVEFKCFTNIPILRYKHAAYYTDYIPITDIVKHGVFEYVIVITRFAAY